MSSRTILSCYTWATPFVQISSFMPKQFWFWLCDYETMKLFIDQIERLLFAQEQQSLSKLGSGRAVFCFACHARVVLLRSSAVTVAAIEGYRKAFISLFRPLAHVFCRRVELLVQINHCTWPPKSLELLKKSISKYPPLR